MQVNTKFLVCSLIYMGSLSANAVGSSSLANETVHVSILSADQTKNELFIVCGYRRCLGDIVYRL